MAEQSQSDNANAQMPSKFPWNKDPEGQKTWHRAWLGKELLEVGERHSDTPPPEPPGSLSRVVSVCSDVHLGTRYAQDKDFYRWLAARRSDETVVLLGDILDFWIFSNFDKGIDLVDRVVAEWDELWHALAKLHKRGTKLHYVPGNHDAFVFFVETSDHFAWSRAVMKHSEELQRIRHKTKARRMVQLASIHYPFLQLPIGGQQILFTHGHYSNWGWRQLTGIQEGVSRASVLFLTTASIVLAHKHAGLLRRSVNELDWLRRVHGIEDIAIAITNAIVQAYEGAHQMLQTKPANMVKVIDLALSIYFGSKPAMTTKEEIKIRDALLALSKIQGPHVPEDMQDIWDDTMKYLRQASSEQNVHLDVSNQQQARAPRFTPFSDFVEPEEPKRLVFGHYHNPRTADPSYDVGGFVGANKTFFNIREDGSIDRKTQPA